MTGEIIAIVGVGIAVVAFNWRVMVRLENRLDGRIDRLDDRIDRLQLGLEGLRNEFHALARELSELRGEIRGNRE